jgi:phenylacetate-coenzyme A ligase PaaK-like adenylate-forming protein
MNPSHLPETEALFETDPFEFSPATEALFRKSFREVAWRHYRGNALFRSFWDKAGLTPDSIQTEKDLERAPAMMVHLFKEWDLASIPRDEIVLRLTSSGTGGQKSQMLLNEESLRRVKRQAYRIHERLGLTAPEEKVNYLCFTYDPAVADDLGTAFTDELLTNFTQKKNVYYSFQWDEAKGDFSLNEDGVLAVLDRYQEEGLPVRILGFPAFLSRILQKSKKTYSFGPRSFVQTGGGWKGLADEEIPKPEFRKSISERLGLPVENIRDLFGMVEHGIPYVDCEKGQMHVPNYGRVFIRDPFTGGLVPDGEKGLLQFICTYNDAYPSMNFLSTDWGRLSRCDCGLPGATLEILGRAGVSKHKGCAIQALETLL